MERLDADGEPFGSSHAFLNPLGPPNRTRLANHNRRANGKDNQIGWSTTDALYAGENMKRWKIYVVFLYSLSALSLNAVPITPATLLGNASSFAVLSSSTVTNTGPTFIWGDLGLSPGTAITSTGSFVIGGSTHAADAAAANARIDAIAAYGVLAGSGSITQNLTGKDLGGLTLTPGVYKFDSSAGLTGALTLNPGDNPNSLFIFQIGSTLTTASGSSVVTTNNANCCNVYWQVGSSATLGTGSDFLGNILANTSITLTTGANITHGRAIALNGAVTLDTNNISNVVCDTAGGFGDTSAVPEPGTLLLLGAGLSGLVVLRRISRKRAA
jgi:type VI secretion system secreted protein VgrG